MHDPTTEVVAVDTIFQASDLATKRREFINAARDGRAHLRDTDGTNIVALRAHDLEVLEKVRYWSGELLRLAKVLARSTEPSVADLGQQAWLRTFDHVDMLAFVAELEDLLIAGSADRDLDVLDEAVRAWRVTARQLDDPLRRAVLTAAYAPDDFEDSGLE